MNDHLHKWWKRDEQPGPRRDWVCVECGIAFAWTEVVWEQYVKAWKDVVGVEDGHVARDTTEVQRV